MNQNSRATRSGFSHPKNPGKIEDHTPIQKQILKELNKLKEKKLHPTDNAESSMNFLEQFDWTVTLLIELEKQAFENILVKEIKIP